MEPFQIMTIIGTIGLIILIYHYLYGNNNYWTERGIPCVKGALPIIGNNLPLLMLRESFIILFNNFYKSYPNHSMVGYYNFQKPGLIIRDPDLIKTILLTKFSCFNDNTSSMDSNLDPLLCTNPFFTKAEEWKTNRTILLNGFSSKKLKLNAVQIRDVCAKFTKFLQDKTKGHTISLNIVDDLAFRFTAEVVAIAGFGIDGKSFTKSPESFRSMAGLMFEPASWDEFIQIVAFFFPWIARVFRLRFLPKKLDNYFRQVVKSVLQSRKNSSGPHGDFLEQISNLCRDESSGEIKEDAVVAHCASFFLDGYLTSGMTMSFAAYQIAAHPNVQEKIRQEVITILDKYQGEISYEALQNMKYLEQVVNESMRLFPALAYLGKLCTEPVKLVGYDGLECVVEPGTEIIICTMELQRDPRFWDNPNTFDPDRFNDDKKNNRHKYVFLPFGSGPRICVGMRIAMMQIKAALATLLLNYSIKVDPKTREPIEVHPLSGLFTAPSSHLWLRIKSLQHE